MRRAGRHGGLRGRGRGGCRGGGRSGGLGGGGSRSRAAHVQVVAERHQLRAEAQQPPLQVHRLVRRRRVCSRKYK